MTVSFLAHGSGTISIVHSMFYKRLRPAVPTVPTVPKALYDCGLCSQAHSQRIRKNSLARTPPPTHILGKGSCCDAACLSLCKCPDLYLDSFFHSLGYLRPRTLRSTWYLSSDSSHDPLCSLQHAYSLSSPLYGVGGWR